GPFARALGAEWTRAVTLLLRDGDEISRQILGQGHPVNQRIDVQQISGIVVDHSLEKRLPVTHDGSTVFLALAYQRVDRAPGIAAGDELEHLDLPRATIDFNFGPTPADLPEDARRFERRVVIDRRHVEAVRGELEAR